MSTVSVDRSPPRRAFTLPTARERGLYHANPWHRTAIAGDSWQAFPGPRRIRIAWQDDPPQPLSSSSTSCRRPPPASRSSRTGSPRLLLIISVSSTPIPGANFRPYLSGSTRARPPRFIPGGRTGIPGGCPGRAPGGIPGSIPGGRPPIPGGIAPGGIIGGPPGPIGGGPGGGAGGPPGGIAGCG